MGSNATENYGAIYAWGQKMSLQQQQKPTPSAGRELDHLKR